MHTIRIEITNAKAVGGRLKKIPERFYNLEKSFWNTKMAEYKRLAKWIISDVIYYAYTPRTDLYTRTKALRNSVKTEKITDGMRLYQDSTMTLAELPGKFTSYPLYFLYGGGFLEAKNAMPVRDFLKAWYTYFKHQFRRDYDKEVVKPALKDAA